MIPAHWHYFHHKMLQSPLEDRPQYSALGSRAPPLKSPPHLPSVYPALPRAFQCQPSGWLTLSFDFKNQGNMHIVHHRVLFLPLLMQSRCSHYRGVQNSIISTIAHKLDLILIDRAHWRITAKNLQQCWSICICCWIISAQLDLSCARITQALL